MIDQRSDIKAAAIRGLRVALFTFFGTFLPALTGFLHSVSDWAASNGSQDFPATSVLVYTAVAAVSAAITGLIGFAWNWIENTQGFAIFGAKQDRQT